MWTLQGLIIRDLVSKLYTCNPMMGNLINFSLKGQWKSLIQMRFSTSERFPFHAGWKENPTKFACIFTCLYLVPNMYLGVRPDCWRFTFIYISSALSSMILKVVWFMILGCLNWPWLYYWWQWSRRNVVDGKTKSLIMINRTYLLVVSGTCTEPN